MINRGLSNRFPHSVRRVWIYWYSCLLCGKNQWDALHHIISPSVRFYVKGKHNKSILNSCPIHNQGCHIGKEDVLCSDEKIRELLRATRDALEFMGYKLKPIDIEFSMLYSELYEKTGDSREPVKSF